MYGCAKHNEIAPFGILVGSRIRDDEIFHRTEVNQPDAGEHSNDASDGFASEMKNSDQRRNKKQRGTDVGIAPKAEFEKGRQCCQHKTGDDPVFEFMH